MQPRSDARSPSQPTEAMMLTLVATLIEEADRRRIAWCHWKSNQRIVLSVQGRTDLDLLVPSRSKADFCALLSELGFVEFRSRPWGRYPGVTDWLGCDAETGVLVHVHLHVHMLTGLKGVKQQVIAWDEVAFANLERDAATGVPIPPKALEAHLLLAREVAKSTSLHRLIARRKKRPPISRSMREEMSYLQAEAGEGAMREWGQRLWGSERWRRMEPHMLDGEWFRADRFAVLRSEVTEALRPHRTSSVDMALPGYFMMLLRKHLARLGARMSGGTTSGKRMIGRAPIIAVVGADGAGKSTVTADLRGWLGWKADRAWVYFGSNHPWFRKLARLGRVTQRKQPSGERKKAPGERKEKSGSRKDARFPVWAQAIRALVAAEARAHQQKKAFRLASRGTIIIGDRYPQNEVEGTFDGPSGLGGKNGGFLASAILRREKALFQRMASNKPDLVIKLVVSPEVAMARKPDHDPETLRRKIGLTRDLSFGGAQAVVIDSTLPLETVIATVRNHVWKSVREAAGRSGSANL